VLLYLRHDAVLLGEGSEREIMAPEILASNSLKRGARCFGT
jgi:hypothetical protein